MYPDLYDVGMSYYGFQILYHILNRESDIRADRAYAPWPDFEEMLRKHHMHLYGVETKVPLKDFDVIGFTLPYELTSTNILNIIDLAGLPVLSCQRDEGPIIIAGGSNVYNPEPLADFIDLFIVGDSEDVIVPLVRFLAEQRKNKLPRMDILKTAALKFQGVYAPAFYNNFHESENGLPKKILARRVPELKNAFFPEKPLIPVVEIAQDRLVAEIMRGCTQGCRFCQAGMIYRPVRERLPEDIRRQIIESLNASGYDDVSLLSLSSSDYCGMGELINGITGLLEERRIGLSLPSLRLDSFSESMAVIAQKTRKSGLTFAPEAGSARLRNVINKNISEEDLMNSVDIALKYGWRSVKLYFMLGLPTETDEDIEEIVRLTKTVYFRAKKQLSINITLSTFVPKPFTPFQWEAQDEPAEIQRKLDIIKRGLAPFKRIKIMARDPYYSHLEGAIARGDRRMGAVIHSAWKKGAIFDSWRELFQPEKWREAFSELQIDPHQFTGKHDVSEPLPWDRIDALVSKDFLRKEREQAYRAEKSPDCRDGCIGCGVCDDALSMQIVDEKKIADQRVSKTVEAPTDDKREQKYRLKYRKKGLARFISHLDTLRVFQQAMRRAGLQLSFTRGFNRRPKISAGYPLPLGYTSNDEYIDITLIENGEKPITQIRLELPAGLQVVFTETVSLKTAPLFAATTGFEYEVRFFDKPRENLRLKIKELLARREIIIERTRKGQMRQIDVRPFIEKIVCENERTLRLFLNVIGGRTVRPEELLKQLAISQKNEICRLKTKFD